MSHDDFDFEPIPGIPAPLPAEESLLWQGSPQWWPLAVSAYHVRKVAIYLALIVALQALPAAHASGHAAGFTGFMLLIGLGAAALAILSLLAFLSARATVYSITTRRILIRYGVAVPMTLNVPLRLIDAIDLKRVSGSCGDLYFQLARSQRIGYLITWPNVRPGRFARPVPTFRSLDDLDGAVAALETALSLAPAKPRLDSRAALVRPIALPEFDVSSEHA